MKKILKIKGLLLMVVIEFIIMMTQKPTIVSIAGEKGEGLKFSLVWWLSFALMIGTFVLILKRLEQRPITKKITKTNVKDLQMPEWLIRGEI